MSNFFAALIALSMTLRVQRGSRSAEALSRKLQSHTRNRAGARARLQA